VTTDNDRTEVPYTPLVPLLHNFVDRLERIAEDITRVHQAPDPVKALALRLATAWGNDAASDVVIVAAQRFEDYLRGEWIEREVDRSRRMVQDGVVPG
jgi:hypothetical protein